LALTPLQKGKNELKEKKSTLQGRVIEKKEILEGTKIHPHCREY
jgi:hypothetical protein